MAQEVSQVATALGLVAAGEGIAILLSYAIARAIVEPGPSTETLTLVAQVVRREIVALTREADPLSPACVGFTGHFRQVSCKS
jgi:DNA-binding transcriptional LysR family regulator